ncbi:T9SS-dependent choice-of-anchor J family protein [Bergeyella zoohelcum]|uniref:Hemagglutinin A n=1 Tax=Bergeyella zoohelcum TaxID=1015 RepID=A0A7Z8YPP8_9FLAO|nr:choice-of-anchor J domain-containing protein [Bergeyella zoohelcum]VDH05198.1 Hemagglutinin A precursor [Bergeyella zoohelcum]
MKKILLSAVLLQAVNFANAQVTLLNDSFETYTDFAITGIGNWQTLDLDNANTYIVNQAYTWPNAGSPQAFIIFNPTATTPPLPNDVTVANENFDAHTGVKYAASFSSENIQSNDWLITPQLTLGTNGNSVSFWVKSVSDHYGLDKYRVGVYTGGGDPASESDFTIISGPTELSAPTTWTQMSFNLDAYAGQNVKIGIRNASTDIYMLMVDDVVVTTAQLSTNELTKKDGVSVENPTTGIVKIITEKKIQYAKVFDATGKLVSDKVVDNTVDISAVPSGVYYLNVLTTDNKVTTKKVIKK